MGCSDHQVKGVGASGVRQPSAALVPPAELGSHPGGAESCRGLRDNGTINLIGSDRDQVYSATTLSRVIGEHERPMDWGGTTPLFLHATLAPQPAHSPRELLQPLRHVQEKRRHVSALHTQSDQCVCRCIVPSPSAGNTHPPATLSPHKKRSGTFSAQTDYVPGKFS
jgi:hypothetical protein